MATVLDIQWVQNPNAANLLDPRLLVTVPKDERLYSDTQDVLRAFVRPTTIPIAPP